MIRLILLGSLVLTLSALVSAQNKSVYTRLDAKNCKELKSNPNEGSDYEGECRGVGGFKLRVIEGDLRQSIDVVTPSRKKIQLGFWNVSGAFSNIGDKAEWRMKGKTPVALIVRFNASENPEDSTKITSYLIVSRISRTKTCITDVVASSRTQNADARKAADAATTRPCKFSQ